MDPFIKRILVLLAVIVIGAVTFIIGLRTNADKDLGGGQEYSSPTGPAVMDDSEELYRMLDDDYQFTHLREDLAYFGRTTMAAYRDGKVVDVVFKVSKIESKDGGIHFEGFFAEQKDKITGQITPLNYGKIKTNITNTATNTEINSSLPSNSKYNLFIGSLPINRDDYSVNYSLDTDTFLVKLNERNPSLNVAAEKDIAEGLGLESTEGVKIQYIVPSQYGI